MKRNSKNNLFAFGVLSLGVACVLLEIELSIGTFLIGTALGLRLSESIK